MRESSCAATLDDAGLAVKDVHERALDGAHGPSLEPPRRLPPLTVPTARC